MNHITTKINKIHELFNLIQCHKYTKLKFS